MSFASGYKGVVGLVFGNENTASSEDSYVERLLDRIHNGTKTEDRRSAIVELQSVVAENHAAQLAFGAIGFPVIIGVLKEERDDVEMVRGALETLLSSVTPLSLEKPPKIEVEPSKMNADLLSREMDNISLLLGLLEEDDFYVRYYTLQVLTALLANFLGRLQEAILAIPRGITRLMDMMMDREVIRNEALLLLTHLTREAEEIQKIVVFEGAFEKIFSIIKEEGALDGGVVVQDCLELLKNILRNTSNQTLLRETIGFDPVIMLLKLRGSAYNFTQQKTVNLLSALETFNMLITGGPQTEIAKDTNSMTNKTGLGQKRVVDHLLLIGVESQWVPIAVRCAALLCIGDLIAGHSNNLNELANKVLGDELREEPAVNSILRIILRTSSLQEFVAADHIFKNFCERNPDGQKLLASTLTPTSHSVTHVSLGEDTGMSFGSMLIHGLAVGENDGDFEICARAASVLSYLLKDNIQCKERALKIELELLVNSMETREPLMHRMVKYLALASSTNNRNEKSKRENSYIQQLILKALIIWFVDCPSAVQCFLDARPNLTYLLELLSNQSGTICTKGLAAVLLGECVLYNKCIESGKDSYAIVDMISQKAGLSSYFSKFAEMQNSSLFSPERYNEQRKPLTRGIEGEDAVQNVDGDPLILASVFDHGFVALVGRLEANIRERIVEVYSNPKVKVAVVPAELKQRSDESDGDYISRLKSFVEKQCSEVQDLLGRNSNLAEDLARTGVKPEQRTSTGPSDRVQVDSLRRDLQEASQRLEILKAEKSKLESEASMYKNLAAKVESDLKGLSDAYNSLERANLQLEKEAGRSGSWDIESIKAEVREEAEKESEAELNDLLVCLGQEQSKVERLTDRLVELGEDVDKLLEGIGDDAALPQDDQDDEEEED